jgi:hypothetical protein
MGWAVRRLIDQDRAREARRQGVLLDRLARQFEGRLANEIAAAMREMVNVWTLTREVVPARGFRARLEAAYEQMIRAAVVTFGTRIWEQAKSAGYELETKRDPSQPDFAATMTAVAGKYVGSEAVRRRITGVDDETRQGIIRAVAKGYSDGLGQNEVAARITESVPSISKLRAKVIARTETHGAANYGSFEAAKATGVRLNKEWLAAADERTRETHLEADGQTVTMDGTFRVGDALMEYPGDPAGPAEEVINCRCTMSYVLAEDESGQTGQTAEPPQEIAVPSTIEGLEKFIVDKGIARATAIAGMSPQAIAQAARAALNVVERFDIQPLNGFGPSTRFGLKAVKNANAAIVYGTQNGRSFAMFHTPVRFGNVAAYEKQRAANIRQASVYKAEAQAKLKSIGNRVSPDVLNRFERLQPDEYSWTFSGLLPTSQTTASIAYHEYGHVLHLVDRQMGPKINAFLSKERPLDGGWQYLVSKYAGANNREYIAETFSIYMHGDKSQFYRIHPELLAIYREADKRK